MKTAYTTYSEVQYSSISKHANERKWIKDKEELKYTWNLSSSSLHYDTVNFMVRHLVI
jgi:hypothetical protein